ncbi:MAG: hypothetical protein ACRDKI_06235, partial [Solirubrobacterales bacterium]
SDAAINGCTSPTAAKTLAAGPHTFKVTATNAAGSGSVTRNFTVAAVPSVTINTPADGSTVGSPVTATFTVASATSTTCQWDAEAVIASCTSPLAPKTLTPGPHSFKVSASNVSGTTTETSNFTVLAVPTVSIDDPADGSTVPVGPTAATFSVGGGAASSVTCQWDSDPVINSCTSPTAPKTLAAGPHTFKVTATNIAGSATATGSFTALASPTVVINAPADGSTVASPVTGSFTLGGGAASEVSCQWDSENELTPCSSPTAPKPLSAGPHSFTVTVSNAVGSDSATSTFDVIAAPTVTVTAPTAGQTVGSPVTAQFTLGGGTAASVTCQWDAEAVIGSCTSPVGPKALTPGPHSFKVTATNIAGSATVTRSFTVGAVPSISIATPADGTTVPSPVTASFTATGATSVSCQWDAEAAISSCTSPQAPKTLTPGPHSFMVTASNASGTTSMTSNFTVLSPPTVTISDPDDGSTVTSPVTAAFVLGGGAASSVTCRWDAEAVINGCTSPVGPKSLAGGQHTFKVTATNAAGTASATSTFTIPVVASNKLGATTIIVHFPKYCELQDGDEDLAPYARFHVSNARLEEMFNGDATHDQWGEFLPGIAAMPHNAAGRSTTDCRNYKIKRIVRADGSAITNSLKQFLAGINPTRGWTGGFSGINWPHTANVITPATGGAASQAAKARSTQGSIGYVDLATARANAFKKLAESASTMPDPAAYRYTNANSLIAAPASGWTYTFNKRLFWIPLERTTIPGAYAEPTATPMAIRTNKKGSNCPGVASGDWSIATGGEPASAYPLCVADENAPAS